MSDLLTLLKIILFSSVTVLNETPFDLDQTPVAFTPDEPLDVLTPGAHLRIDVSDRIGKSPNVDRLEKIKRVFPEGCVVAVLQTPEGAELMFDRSWGSVSSDESALNLTSSSPLAEGTEFVHVTVSSCKLIRKTTVSWANSSS